MRQPGGAVRGFGAAGRRPGRGAARSAAGSSTPSANNVDPSSPTGLTYGQEAQDQAAGIDPATGQQMALPAPGSEGIEQKIDIARIEGQVKASSVKRVAEFVDKHPEESVSILRTWLH